VVWSCEVLIGVVGFVGARLGKVKALLRRGVVWSVEALHSMVKFGPVKHCEAGLGAFWYGDVLWGGVWSCLVRHSKALLWLGEVKHSIAGRCSVRRGLALFWQGAVEQSEVRRAELLLRRGIARSSTLVSGLARLRAVRHALAPLWLGAVMRSLVMSGRLWLFLGMVGRSPVRFSPVRQASVSFRTKTFSLG